MTTTTTTHHDIGPAEHGARAGIFYGRCACGWSSHPRQGLQRAADITAEHIARTLVLAELCSACSEGDHPNDDNPGDPMCRTCRDWHVDATA